MTPPKPRLPLAALLLLASATASAAPGRYGFGVEAETSGLLRPVLERVTVASVQPGSPAAAAGLTAGDRVVDIDGRPVQGAAARPMAARLRDVDAGRHLRLGVLRAGGRVVVGTVAVPKP
jgi:C-terminal processing protease CtpA/Prc